MPYYFNLPQAEELTLDQQRAVEETAALSLSGGPGTGKSVVCLWRHIQNHSTGLRDSVLLTYTKTLEHYLKAAAATQDADAEASINRINWWLCHSPISCDEIIIDEAQDIDKEKFERFFEFSNVISYGADERQSLYLGVDKLQELLKWFKSDRRFSENHPITLNRNFRNSREILTFTRSVFPDFLIAQNVIDSATQTNLKPIMKLNSGRDFADQVREIIGIIYDFNSDTHNIAILVPTIPKVQKYYDEIKAQLANDFEITKYHHDDEEFGGLSGVHITTFRSSKGTEFDTVIIPDFDSFRWNLANLNVVNESDYYVAFTRSRSNLFLICRGGFPNIGARNTVTIE
jgi:superfamily I DNA/RNA helicase